MEFPRGLFDAYAALHVLTRQHIGQPTKQLSQDHVALVPFASHALRSAHIAFFACFNAALDRDIEVTIAMDGNPGEDCPAVLVRGNWRKINRVIRGALPNGTSVAEQAEIEEIVNDSSQVIVSVYWKLLSVLQNPELFDQRTGPSRALAESVEWGRERYLQKVKEEQAKREAQEKERLQAQRLRSSIEKKYRMDRYHMQIEVPTPPLVLRQYENRGVVLFCHEIVDGIVREVETGEAQQALRRRASERERLRQTIAERRAERAHLPVTQQKFACTNRVALVALREIVLDIVNEAMREDIIDVLIQRSQEKARQREIVRSINAQRQQELCALAADPPLPLKLRLEMEKKEREENEKRLRAQNDEKFRILREKNHERAVAAKREAERSIEEQALEEAKLVMQNARRHIEREEYFFEARQKIARQKLQEEAAESTTSLISQESDIREKLQRAFGIGAWQLNRSTKAAAKNAERPPIVLSDTSYSSGDTVTGIGDTPGMRFFTERETDLFNFLGETRADPQTLLPHLAQMKSMLHGTRTLWYCSDSLKEKVPMATIEGSAAVDECSAALPKIRPRTPEIGTPSVALTLAARQHAADLAYHGIANCITHMGTDGAMPSQRVSRYTASACNCRQLVYGIVRPKSSGQMEPVDVAAAWAISDGDTSRMSRSVLFLNGPAASMVGVGNAVFTLQDRIVEVYCVVFSEPMIEKDASQMAEAHIKALQSVAPSTLQGVRVVEAGITVKMLYAAPNCTIGRVVALPNVNDLMLRKSTSQLELEHKRAVKKDVEPTAISNSSGVAAPRSSAPPPRRTQSPQKTACVPDEEVDV